MTTDRAMAPFGQPVVSGLINLAQGFWVPAFARVRGDDSEIDASVSMGELAENGGRHVHIKR
jgi:hypothetical protein